MELHWDLTDYALLNIFSEFLGRLQNQPLFGVSVYLHSNRSAQGSTFTGGSLFSVSDFDHSEVKFNGKMRDEGGTRTGHKPHFLLNCVCVIKCCRPSATCWRRVLSFLNMD